MPALTRAQSTKKLEELYPPLFSQVQTQPWPCARQRTPKKPRKNIDTQQTNISQPLQVDPLSMYSTRKP